VNTAAYDKDVTALLVVDPHNDFIFEGGKIWPRIKAVAEANNCVGHMLEVLEASRRAKLPVFYTMHHRYRPANTLHPFKKARVNTLSFAAAQGRKGTDFH
jgi:ureidoacrylate peracid hydrolase